MIIKITRREVLNNLLRFKDRLTEMRKQQGQAEGARRQRVYTVLVNRRTGDMRFAQKISALDEELFLKGRSQESLEEWREVHLIAQEGSYQAAVNFDLVDEGGAALNVADIGHVASRVLLETLEVLNQKGSDVPFRSPEMLPEEVILQDLSSIQLQRGSAPLEELPGWAGTISRKEAEEQLKEKPLYTYLLREGDRDTRSLGFHFSEENRTFVHCYLLTFVDQEEKISELLLLHTKRGWTHYLDDPDLSQSFYHYYPSPDALLQSLQRVAQFPLITSST